jgi:two-component system response regulator AtoC
MDQLSAVIVGADADTSGPVAAILQHNGLRAATAIDGSEGLIVIQRQGADLLFVELAAPGCAEFLRRALLLRPHVAVIGMAASASLDSAVEAMRMGACDYLVRPLDEAEIVAATGRALARRLRLQSPSTLATAGPPAKGGELTMALDCHILAAQVPARKLLAFIAKLAPGQGTVQVQTEPGAAPGPADLPTGELREMISVLLTGDLKHVERQIVEEMIRRLGGNKTAAARALGLHRRTLYRLLSREEKERD